MAAAQTTIKFKQRGQWWLVRATLMETAMATPTAMSMTMAVAEIEVAAAAEKLGKGRWQLQGGGRKAQTTIN
jgi:hypothetical protein